MSIFDKFAASFPLVSDENTRWTKEGPLLMELAASSNKERPDVLDLACGSGFHARHLAMADCDVTGVDLSGAAIEAGIRLPGGDAVLWVQGDLTDSIGRTFNLALLLGNTLSLFDDRAKVERAIEAASQSLVRHGALLIQVIDFDHLRANPVRIKREGVLDGDPVTFEKSIDGNDTGGLITITFTRQTESEPHTESGTRELHEWGAGFLIDTASRFGLRLCCEYGGLDRSDRAPGQSRDVVLAFRKQ